VLSGYGPLTSFPGLVDLLAKIAVIARSSGSASKTRRYSTGGVVVAKTFAKRILVSGSTSGFLKIQFFDCW